jgi:hypothetical protein
MKKPETKWDVTVEQENRAGEWFDRQNMRERMDCGVRSVARRASDGWRALSGSERSLVAFDLFQAGILKDCERCGESIDGDAADLCDACDDDAGREDAGDAAYDAMVEDGL